MPVGKNSIKRVTNNGYSQVATSAPDMENSTVIANPGPEVVEMVAPKEKAPTKKTTSRKPAAKKPAAPKAEEAPAAPATDTPAVDTTDKETAEYGDITAISLGDDLPYYLL